MQREHDWTTLNAFRDLAIIRPAIFRAIYNCAGVQPAIVGFTNCPRYPIHGPFSRNNGDQPRVTASCARSQVMGIVTL